jgi:DNA-binding NtrC family response regulator
VARALHRLSPVSGLPLVVLDAAEAELRFARPETMGRGGWVEGMLYLPEAGRLSRAAQSGLLAHCCAGPAPGNTTAQGGMGRSVVRVVAFAGHGLRPLVSAGAFSAELADLLESLRLVLPPLRERARTCRCCWHGWRRRWRRRWACSAGSSVQGFWSSWQRLSGRATLRRCGR